MCQIIWDSQFVHNAHILALWMQHYSKTVSFQEIQCSGEVNIYLHNLTLLSDCLIFPGIFPSSFTPPPSSASKHLVQKRHDFPRGFGSQWSWWCNVCSPLFLGAPWICSASWLTASAVLLHHLQILLQHLQRLPPPLPPTSSLVIRTPSPPHPTPLHPHSFLLLLLLLLSFSPPAQPSAASP